MNVAFSLLNVDLIEISRSPFKQFKNPFHYTILCNLGFFCKFLGGF